MMKNESKFLCKNQSTAANFNLNYSKYLLIKKDYSQINLNVVLKSIKDEFVCLLGISEDFMQINRLPIIMAKQKQIHHLFKTIIGNALKFKGEEPLNIIISAEDQETMWEIKIKDNAIAVEDIYHKSIFEEANYLKRNVHCKRAEIGLLICRKILEAHGGTITIQSNPVNGCEFTIWLPKTQF
ncbi:MAG: ATP-binding protein [Candidatus Paracaedibacteraceae bacterium]|nr:ATP-binding protein [Candidatus Paracaedibacteraceae bacterium]